MRSASWNATVARQVLTSGCSGASRTARRSSVRAASTAGASAPAASGHHAEGVVDDVDRQAGTVSVSHGPVASLKWPAMTMEFVVANVSLLKDLKPGAKVAFEFVERAPGEWVITGVKK